MRHGFGSPVGCRQLDRVGDLPAQPPDKPFPAAPGESQSERLQHVPRDDSRRVHPHLQRRGVDPEPAEWES